MQLETSGSPQELERNEVHLAEFSEENAPFLIHGIAIGEGDVTRGKSGDLKKWPKETLEEASDSLEERPLVEDHENNSRGVIGEVVAVEYEDGVGILYEAELDDPELAKKIDNGRLEVSIRGFHEDVEDMDTTEEGANIVEHLIFDNLSIVPSGAAPSNTVKMGPSKEISAAECSAIFTGAEVDVAADSSMSHSPHLLRFWSHGEVSDGLVDEIVSDLSEPTGINAHASTGTDDREPVILVTVEKDAVPDDFDIDGHIVDALMDTPYSVHDSESFDWVDRIMEVHLSDRPEGAEEQGNPDKHEEETYRFPEGNDTPPDDSKGMHEHEENAFPPINMVDSTALQDVTVHEPEWSETDERDWNKPNLEDFTDESWEDLSADEKRNIGDHFLVSMSGFPADTFGDMKLPVVEPDGTLNLNALQNAKARLSQTDGLSGDDEDRVESIINGLANDNFDADFGSEEENATTVARRTKTAVEFADGRTVIVNPDGTVEELRSRNESTPRDDAEEETQSSGAGTGGEPDTVSADDVTFINQGATMSDIEEQLNDYEEPTVIEADELEQLRDAAEDDSEDQSNGVEELKEAFRSDLEELKDRTAVLEEVDRADVEELAERDNPVIMEQEKFDELEETIDEVEGALSAALAEHWPLEQDTIQDKLSVQEMYDELSDLAEDGSVEEELTPDPQGTDPEEEEAEEAAEERHGETEASESEEVEEKRAELREKYFNK